VQVQDLSGSWACAIETSFWVPSYRSISKGGVPTTAADELDFPVLLSVGDWLESATALESLILDQNQRYEGRWDKTLLAYRAMLEGLLGRIGPDGREAATRGTRWVW
jgi:hypothetical protein